MTPADVPDPDGRPAAANDNLPADAAQEDDGVPERASVTASWTMAVERETTPPPSRSATRRQGGLDIEAGWSVECEIDSSLRVTDAEVQVLETYLGRQLDALFEGAHPSQNDRVDPNEAVNLPVRKEGR
jgi:hypothetical protein